MRGKATPCVWNDTEYESITQLARSRGKSPAAQWALLKKGYTRDSDIGKRGNRTHTVTYLWNDTLYPDIETMADALYLTPHGVWWRLRQGHVSDASMRGAA